MSHNVGNYNAVNWAAFESRVPQASYTQLNLNRGSHAQAEGRLWRDVLATDLVPIQSQRLQFGEVGDIHNAAETTQSEL